MWVMSECKDGNRKFKWKMYSAVQKKLNKKNPEIHHLTDGIAMKRNTEVRNEKFEAIGKEERKTNYCE